MTEHADPAPAEVAGEPLLRIEAVEKRFGGFVAVDRLSLDIKAGEFFALLGPSGCGKTTLLRMLAGFETPDAGRILLNGVDIAAVLPHERPVNMMFQNYALFPHLTVAANIAFGLKRARLPRKEIKARVAEMLALVRLEGLGKRKPDQLSGGQQQRVALARALALRPKLLLLDEPMAALDKKLRESTQLELMALQKRLGMTFVIVTHDQQEAMTMADRIGVMRAGKLDQVAVPRQLYEAPASRWVAEFVGDVNMLEGSVAGRDNGRITVATGGAGEVVVAEPREALQTEAISVAIRPEKIKLSLRGPAADAGHADAINRLDGTITDIGYAGGMTSYKVRLDHGATLLAAMANTTRLDVDAYHAGQHVVAWFSPDDCVVLTR
ncbi:Spermidine/putrescine import ATP-binding protein PotA [Rhodopseudomonas palustris]|uniref:Spermidine/putrescine import ATP-binding protein PotA n=1 Tax=Rhodopseudomonas palustris (strain ATCC BAA-98 / CGA009) TaxID=258594 RepID=Q6N290_RHOPA|nr:ABC transporter ATP-binding protein [Rhodopseudomonas palustris]OPF92441.1 polyamine ABC transporter ATP-binding protein [Rhodopseudomonas palustris]QQM05724.1 Spermidine/putrescine import ATP-binding protein PotA [Rhodopseudomonas palustris]RJF63945.1 polyamine ABC transporter ATP-binding protein [Rhodopseudomonas palustris]WAB77052.1 ABC transporter ATP-binding protein [Rhodopseudomonas palustris]WCL94349.1 ABC transporter ATP-binding protein [Rhodopseudomonas palustris CGA009]